MAEIASWRELERTLRQMPRRRCLGRPAPSVIWWLQPASSPVHGWQYAD